ncbi:uncharacterized protein LOC144642253 [Oculina patagonica]
MGFKAALLLIFWLSKSTLGAINETYSETHCKLVTDGNDVSTEFRTKSSEHGVRMVYLHLNVGNESYNPLQSYDRFLPSRWTWARGVDEPMLSFSYQYQVLSLGLLRNQVRSTKVALSDEPRGCLANLTSTSKDIVVARTLLEKVIDDHDSNSPLPSEDVVCVSVVQRSMDKLTALYYGNVEYRCCRKQKRGNRTVVQCDLPAKEDIWLSLFYHELTIGVIIAFFSWPGVLLLLPDSLFLSTKNAIQENVFFYYFFDFRRNRYCLIPAVIFFFMPGNLIYFAESNIEIDKLQKELAKSIQDLAKTVISAECVKTWVTKYKNNVGNDKFYGPNRITKEILEYLKRLRYSPFVVLIKFIKNIIDVVLQNNLLGKSLLCPWAHKACKKERLWSKISCLFNALFAVWIIYFSLAVCMCGRFFIRMFGFVTMGLIINAQQTTPYVIFIYVLTRNIVNYYGNYQNRYKKVKKMIFKQYQELANFPNAKINPKTIPEALFWSVCNERNVLPIQQETFCILVTVLITSSILLLALATIVFFGEEYNFSPLISAAAVFLSGKIADIFLQRESLQGWSKIRKKEEIREAVKEWRKSETTNREMKNEKADAVIDNNADTKELAV